MIEYNQIFQLDLLNIVMFYLLMAFYSIRLHVFADSRSVNSGNSDGEDEGFFSKIKKFIKNNYREILLVTGCLFSGGVLCWYLDISLFSCQKGYLLHRECFETLKTSREVLEIFNCLYYENFTKVGPDLVIDGPVAQQLDKIQDLHERLNKLLQENPLEYIFYLNNLAQHPSQSEFLLLLDFKQNVLVNWLQIKNGFENEGWTSITIDGVKMLYFPPLEEQ